MTEQEPTLGDIADTIITLARQLGRKPFHVLDGVSTLVREDAVPTLYNIIRAREARD